MVNTAGSLNAKTVLVVDDNEAILQAVAEILSRASCNVIQASDASQALAALRAHEIDILLTDVFMRDGDGVELLVQLRREGNRMPIFVMSGGGDVVQGDYLKVASDLGASGILRKPFSAKTLLNLLTSVFDDKGGGDNR